MLFCGMRHGADRVNALAAADLFVLPSYQENFGVAAAEALACGIPVLLGAGVNLAGEIAGAGVGSVCETDAGALSGELRRWLTDRPARRRAGARAERFADRYRNAAVAARWAEIWKELTGRGPAPPRPAAGGALTGPRFAGGMRGKSPSPRPTPFSTSASR